MEENKKTAPIERETMTAEQTAQLLGMSYWKLNELCKAKRIPHFMAGNRRLFRRSTLEKWMSEQEAQSISGRAG